MVVIFGQPQHCILLELTSSVLHTLHRMDNIFLHLTSLRVVGEEGIEPPTASV